MIRPLILSMVWLFLSLGYLMFQLSEAFPEGFPIAMAIVFFVIWVFRNDRSQQ